MVLAGVGLRRRASEEEAFLQALDLAAKAESGLYPLLGVNGQASSKRVSPQWLFRSYTSSTPLVERSVQVDAMASCQIDI